MHTHTHTSAVAEQFQAFTRPQLSKQHLNCPFRPLMTSSTSLVGPQKHPSVLLSVGEEHTSTPNPPHISTGLQMKAHLPGGGSTAMSTSTAEAGRKHNFVLSADDDDEQA